MLRGILSKQRVPSAEFQMVTSESSNISLGGKENLPDVSKPITDAKPVAEAKPPRQEKQRKSKTKEQVADVQMTAQAFDKLMDEMQIPDNLRPRLDTMTTGVKAAMLKGSYAVTTKRPHTPRGVRRVQSDESLSSPRHPTVRHAAEDHDLFSMSGPSAPAQLTAAHLRGVSFDAGRQAFRSPEPIPFPQLVPAKNKDKRGKSGTMSPAKYCSILSSTSTVRLEVETVKKLRLLLRNEAASWTEEFLNLGGYSALLTRLNEILEVEWREEQHDDQILHELLRCFKGLSTSAVGCVALRSYAPAPYAQLILLLYSDKRPGDVGTRQLILDLFLILFDIYPPSSLPAAGSPAIRAPSHSRSRSMPWETRTAAASTSNLITLPAPHTTLFSLVRTLLLTPAPPSAEAPEVIVEPHAFIEELHRPRIYKTYLQELSDLCRDYFWVFCHPTNMIWNLEETDEGKVEKPRAPGGMTGGVEFEAMTYMTSHFKFVNAVAKIAADLKLPKDHELSAYKLHNDLFLSGFERIILTARKASTGYYPTLHLEISRYVTAAVRAGFELPWSLSRHVGPPPNSMRKPGAGRSHANASSISVGRGMPSTQSSPTKRHAVAGALPGGGEPNPRKVTPMFGL